MAAILLGKRVSKTISPGDFLNCVQSATRISRARCLSSAYERAEGSNAVAETTNSTSNDSTRQGLYEAKQEASDVDEGRASGVSGFVSETAKDGVEKAVDMAENVGDTAKKTMDGAWKAAKDTAESLKDKVAGDDDDHIDKDPAVVVVNRTGDPIDTQEYRSIEDLRGKAGGYDEAAD